MSRSPGTTTTVSANATLARITAEQVDIPGLPKPRVPSSGSPVGVPVGKFSSSQTVEQSMDLLASTVSAMALSKKAMQKYLLDLQAEHINSS